MGRIRKNLEIDPSSPFFLFSLKNENFGLKINIFKFLGIQSIHSLEILDCTGFPLRAGRYGTYGLVQASAINAYLYCPVIANSASSNGAVFIALM